MEVTQFKLPFLYTGFSGWKFLLSIKSCFPPGHLRTESIRYAQTVHIQNMGFFIGTQIYSLAK